MNNLTPSEARRLIDKLHHNQTKEHGISILEEKYLAALEIALPVLEQQESKRQMTLREAVSELRNLTDESGGYNFEALRAEQDDSDWISCSERMPPSKTGVLVGCWYGREWATKWASLIHGHPDASSEGWLIPGASWVPTHWHPLPASPQQPQTDTYRQIENDGREE